MKINANHLQRYRQIARLLWKYGRSDLVRQMALEDPWDNENPAPAGDDAASPDHLADELEAMGPTFVKLGQVLSSRPDLLPEPYIRALSRLQDRVKPFDGREAAALVEEELGVRISKAFQRFDLEPIASASLGQVHGAALRDGREVVVKVQRPGIVAQVADDFEEIVVPQPVPDFCTKRVLTMDYVQGHKITKVSPIARLEMDGCALAEALFRAYLKQVLVDGLFHADPHPGNVFLTDDYRIALLDLGMVGRTTPGMQTSLLKILIAVSEGRSEDVASIIIGVSQTAEEFDEPVFRRRIAAIVAEQSELSLQQLNVGTTLLQVARIGVQVGLFVPPELTMLGKTLLQLDEVGKILDPEFDPNASIRRNVAEIMSQRMKRDATQGNLLTSMLEMKEFVGELPTRVNKVLDAWGNNEVEVKVHIPDAKVFMQGLEKVANRITTGVVLAAIIIGASLLMRVDTDWRLWGYPGVAMLLFLVAAISGFTLLVNIFLKDQDDRRRGR